MFMRLMAAVLVLVLAVPAFAATGIPVTNGLIAYWPGEDSADDESGNGHNGTMVNGGYTTGVVGRAFNFQGIGWGTALLPSNATARGSRSTAPWRASIASIRDRGGHSGTSWPPS